jgi:hypothetical protein
MSVGFIYSSCPQHPLLQAVSTLLRGLERQSLHGESIGAPAF